jgi:hypothetical protein
MAAIAVASAGKIHVVESIQQKTLPAAETIAAGAPVRIDTTAGTFTNANGTTTGEARVWGIATRSVVAGQPVTAVRRGTLDGFTFSQAYDAAIYLSDTDGTLADAAGTVSTVVGRVVPGTATTLGTAYDKLLSVEL